MRMFLSVFLVFMILGKTSVALVCHYQLPHVILSGLPGSGKGTLSQTLVRDHGYAQICPGDLLRAEVRAGTPLGKSIKHILESGEYVEDEILFDFLKVEIERALVEKKPLIFDGYPRSSKAKELLFTFLKEKDILSKTILVSLYLPEEVARERILNRLACPECKHVFSKQHNSTHAVQKDDSGLYRCPRCGAMLLGRSSDNDSVITKRFSHFRTEIEPLLREISADLATYEVNRNLEKSEFLERLNNQLGSVECYDK